MKVLLLNGSPKGPASNSIQLANAFLQGAREKQELEIQTYDIYAMDLRDCRGCFACWNKTPGQCVIHDDMTKILKGILEADWIVYSFPLYYYSLPSRLKLVFDRQLPFRLPFMDAQNEYGGYPDRYDLSKKRWIFISTCGFYTAQGNYETVTSQLDRLYGKNGYTTIFTGEGELFRVPELKKECARYLDIVRQAGREFAGGSISEAVRRQLEEAILPRPVFERLADASWGVEPESGHIQSEAYQFTRQMAGLYNRDHYDKDRVVEFEYTDRNERYQIVLTKTDAQVKKEDFLPYTTRITTPFAVWQSIAREEIRGDEALMQHLYTVDGDFDLLLRWDDFFGTGAAHAPKGPQTNMLYFLVPWMALWIGAPVASRIGFGLISAGLALLFLLSPQLNLTKYDRLGWIVCAGLAGSLVAGVSFPLVIRLSYLGFGLCWLVSACQKVPLSAWYSMNEYGGPDAWNNPIFMKTNRILTVSWGFLYLLFFLVPALPPMVAWIAPALLGVFTLWFQKWYPTFVARGKRE